jgi:hypothetical protein
VGGTRGGDLVNYNMTQTLSIRENNLVVFVCLGICSTICLAICPCKPNFLAELFNYRLRVEAGMKLIQMNENS